MGKVTEFFESCGSQDQMEAVVRFANAAATLHLNGFDVAALAAGIASDPDGALDEVVALQDRMALFPVAEAIGGKAFAEALVGLAGELKGGGPDAGAVAGIVAAFGAGRLAGASGRAADGTEVG